MIKRHPGCFAHFTWILYVDFCLLHGQCVPFDHLCELVQHSMGHCGANDFVWMEALLWSSTKRTVCRHRRNTLASLIRRQVGLSPISTTLSWLSLSWTLGFLTIKNRWKCEPWEGFGNHWEDLTPEFLRAMADKHSPTCDMVPTQMHGWWAAARFNRHFLAQKQIRTDLLAMKENNTCIKYPQRTLTSTPNLRWIFEI